MKGSKFGDDSTHAELEGPDVLDTSPSLVPVFEGPFRASSLPCDVCRVVEPDGNYWVKRDGEWVGMCEEHWWKLAEPLTEENPDGR